MDGSVCDGCKQPVEWCVCDDPVQGTEMEACILLDAPAADLELNFTDSPREFESGTFEDDFDRELGDLEPDANIEDEQLSEADIQLLHQQDEEYQTWLNDGGPVEEEEL